MPRNNGDGKPLCTRMMVFFCVLVELSLRVWGVCGINWVESGFHQE